MWLEPGQQILCDIEPGQKGDFSTGLLVLVDVFDDTEFSLNKTAKIFIIL